MHMQYKQITKVPFKTRSDRSVRFDPVLLDRSKTFLVLLQFAPTLTLRAAVMFSHSVLRILLITSLYLNII